MSEQAVIIFLSESSVDDLINKCTDNAGLPKDIFQMCKSWICSTSMICSNSDCISSQFMLTGTDSISTDNISRIKCTVVNTTITENIKVQIGSVMRNLSESYQIKAAEINTPIDCNKSPKTWMKKRLLKMRSTAYGD